MIIVIFVVLGKWKHNCLKPSNIVVVRKYLSDFYHYQRNPLEWAIIRSWIRLTILNKLISFFHEVGWWAQQIKLLYLYRISTRQFPIFPRNKSSSIYWLGRVEPSAWIRNQLFVVSLVWRLIADVRLGVVEGGVNAPEGNATRWIHDGCSPTYKVCLCMCPFVLSL